MKRYKPKGVDDVIAVETRRNGITFVVCRKCSGLDTTPYIKPGNVLIAENHPWKVEIEISFLSTMQIHDIHRCDKCGRKLKLFREVLGENR